MSLDGFIADPDDGCDELFGFYGSGDVAVKLSAGFPELHVSRKTAGLLTSSVARVGAASPTCATKYGRGGLTHGPRPAGSDRAARGKASPPEPAPLTADVGAAKTG